MTYLSITMMITLAFYVMYRNYQTYYLRINITDICFNYTIKQIRNGVYDDNALEWCDDQLPSYNKMVFSFHKRLRIKDWLTTEQINKLTNL